MSDNPEALLTGAVLAEQLAIRARRNKDVRKAYRFTKLSDKWFGEAVLAENRLGSGLATRGSNEWGTHGLRS